MLSVEDYREIDQIVASIATYLAQPPPYESDSEDEEYDELQRKWFKISKKYDNLTIGQLSRVDLEMIFKLQSAFHGLVFYYCK